MMFGITSNIQYNELITILSYVLLSYSALNFPIHTLRLLHSHSPAPPLTLSGFCTHSLWLLNSHCTISQLTNTSRASIPLSFLSPTTHVFRGQGYVGLFYETIHLKDRQLIDGFDDASALATLFMVRPIS